MPILGCQRSSRGITRSFHLSPLALQTERNLEIGTQLCTGRSGQQMGFRMFFEGSRVSLFFSPPILLSFFSSSFPKLDWMLIADVFLLFLQITA